MGVSLLHQIKTNMKTLTTMKKVYFNLAHLPKSLQAKFKKGSHWSIQLNDMFTFEGNLYQYIGSDDNGKIIALIK